MGVLSGFILRGPGQAALVAATSLTLSVAFPPIVWISNAAVALYVMRFGLKASVPMLAIALVGAMLLFWAVFAYPVLGLLSAVFFWLPLLLSAMVLRATISLELASLSCVGVAGFVALMCYILLGDPAYFWSELLKSSPQLKELMGQATPTDGVDVLQVFAKLATGLLATGVLLNTLAGLYLGRHWQAQQFQPGGFAESFVGFKLGKVVVTSLLAMCVLGLVSDSGFGFAVAMPLVFLLTVQGLAVVHGVAAAKQWPKVILVSVYLAMLVPHVIALICVLAVVDAWFDLRARA